MSVCPYCSGGQIDNGYSPCYSCGGSGHGGHTNQACMACNGSGQGGRDYVTCWNCHGSGTVSDPVSYSSGSKSKPAKVKPKKSGGGSAKSGSSEWTAGNYIFFAITYLISLGYLKDNTELTEWPLYLLPLIPAGFVGAYWKQLFVITIVLFLLYVFANNQG